MIFSSPLLSGTLVRRHKRFLAEVKLDSGKNVWVHCPNSGSMKGVNVPGSPVLVSPHDDPKRQLQYTWEMIYLDGGWVGVNTMIPNRIVAEAFENRLIPAFNRFTEYHSEVKIADDTRIDFVLGELHRCYVEVKNVTLVENGIARFPDSVTTRGAKHVRHLMAHAKRGGKAFVLFVVQHHAATAVTTADELDPEFGKILRKAVSEGVRIEAWKAAVSPEEIVLSHRLPVKL